MSDVIGWLVVAAVLSTIIWAFWPQISRALRITANEGDELVASLNKAKREVKKDIKAVKRKLTR